MVKVVKGEEKERHETWQAATRGEEFLQIKLLLSAEPPTSDLSLNPPQPGMIVSDCFADEVRELQFKPTSVSHALPSHFS